MAIVEDEVRNESEEENEIEVVVEEDDGDRDSDDSEDDDDDEVLEKKVAELEKRINSYECGYDIHMELINALWRLSELDRWRSAFERLQLLWVIRPEHWLMRLQTEVTLAHSAEAKEQIINLFHHALVDCYSIPILSEWCTWSLSSGDTDSARGHIDEVIRRAGADPLSGKRFWDAKLELEKAHLETLTADSPDYKSQQERVLFCLEEIVSRPLLHNEEALQPLEELAAAIHDQQYVDKVKKQHEVALELLQKLTPYEDKLLTVDNAEEKYTLYQEYIDAVTEYARDDKYAECDINGILKVLYDRGSTECMECPKVQFLLQAYARHVHRCASRYTYCRVLDCCVRRNPRSNTFWTLLMQQAERDGKPFDTVKDIFECALSKSMETFKDAEQLWLSYLEYVRRQTDFGDEQLVQRLRQTFRICWDSLIETWGAEANDSDVPLFWARLEYRRIKEPAQGKNIIEEIFRHGENKSLIKYWEAFIGMEMERDPPLSANKQRDLYRRALKFVTDYPPTVVRMWTDYERDYGSLEDLKLCYDTCETKIKKWREDFEAMKEKITGKKQKKQGKKLKNNKNKKEQEQPENKQKRKAEGVAEATETKRKKDADMEVEEGATETETGSGLKRTHAEDSGEATGSKRQRTDDESPTDSRAAAREACTLFVSNLEFKVDEQKLRDILSQYGEIVSLRLKAGVKAFGGSICYCQYKSTRCVDEALKHDRTPLEGRPMFFSRYSSKKGKAGFKYSTDTEKNKLFVKNLPYSHCTKDALTELFEKYGKLKDVRAVTFKDGKPKGLAYIEYEDEASASLAIEKCHGLSLGGRALDVAVSAPPPKAAPAHSLGHARAAPGHAMRRTQLSSFIPSVLQKPVASTSGNGAHSSGDKRPLSNTDFRNLLLKK